MKSPATLSGEQAASDPVTGYDRSQTPTSRAVCELLHALIDDALPRTDARVWHGHPVWFLGDNPVVGYAASAKSVNLLFWNGQAFGDPALNPVGKARAAQAVFREVGEIDTAAVQGWLRKAKADVFDSKAFYAALRAGRKK